MYVIESLVAVDCEAPGISLKTSAEKHKDAGKACLLSVRMGQGRLWDTNTGHLQSRLG